jgi:acetyl esterase/lipase
VTLSVEMTPPPFDPELGAALPAIAEMIPAALTADLIPALRTGGALGAPTDDELRRDGKFTLEERTVPGLDGDPDLSLLILRPATATGTLGCVYFTHGGGMIIGDNRTGVLEALDWAEEFGLVVVSVEYRLAPETPHPGPINDCYAGPAWTADHADELGYEPGRLIVAGGSADGGLAAALALMARDKGGPALAGQMLIYPMLDDRNDTYSSRQMAGRGIWDSTANDTCWTSSLGE